MKKIKPFHECDFSCLTKTFRIMRITLFLMLAVILQTFANEAYSQKTKLSLDYTNTRLEVVLDEIEELSEFFFLANEKLVDFNRSVSLSVKNKKIDEILDMLFAGTDVVYTITDRKIILAPSYLAENTQQQRSVSGKVTDSGGQALPGVTVVVKSTTQGTVTNANGDYSLSNLPEEATLVFSFVGMQTQELIVGNQTSINVRMEEGTIGIEEVVAIGYGSLKKSDITGAIKQADLEPYKNVAANNILERVKGVVPGLNVNGTNTAGAVPGMIIRGQNSTAASNSPLIILDGAIYNGSIGDINPDDIKNFTVLKDASATAIYGSRSSNGVIIIETIDGQGINGKPKFGLKLDYGISNELTPLKVYDGKGYIQKYLDYLQYTNPNATIENVIPNLQANEYKNYNATPNHEETIKDGYDLVSQIGKKFNTSLNISNSLEKIRYFASVSLNNQKGIILNDDFKHISARINLDTDITDWLNIGVKSFYSLRDYSGDSPDSWSRTRLSPYGSLYNDDGSYCMYPQDWVGVRNPFSTIAQEDKDIQNNLNGILSGTVKIPWIKGLEYRTTFSNEVRWYERFQFHDENTIDGVGVDGTGYRSYSRTYNLLYDNIINYHRVFNEKHDLNVTLLYSYELSSWENLRANAYGFVTSVLHSYNLKDGSTPSVNTGGGQTNGIGQMGRFVYSYAGKYALTGTIRRDGYSAFSKNKKWGVFPSVALRWNIGQEEFLKSIENIDHLAVRVSYGANGNQSIPAYGSLAKMGTSQYLYGGDNAYTVTQYISTLANDDLGWEATTGLNLGLDFLIFNNRINGSIDAYRAKTTDLMFSLSLPTTSGKSSIVSNIGEIGNRGLEISLHTLNIKKHNFNWTSDFAFSLNRNKVVTILGRDDDGDGKEDDLISAGYFIGRSLGTIYNYKVTGMWQQDDVDNGTIMNGLRPGDYKLEDVDGDGAITSDKDRQFIGDTKENFIWSWTNTCEYKDFSLMMYFYSIWGGNNKYLSTSNTPYNELTGAEATVANHPVFDYWTIHNTGAVFPRLDYTSASYRGVWYIDRSFIKLQKISLTWNASQLARKMNLNFSDLKFSLSADNLYTYAPHWIGLDPETNNGVTNSAIPSIRTYLFSIMFNF